MKKIIVVSNTSWYLYNFRLRLMVALADDEYQVIAVAPHDEYAAKIQQAGIRFIALNMDNGGTDPVKDFKLAVQLFRLFRRERPATVLTYTPKPNIYGALAARLLRVPVVCNVAGLGTAFINEGLVTRIARGLYRIALRRADKVFFQNNDDMAMFLQRDLVKPAVAERLPGSGVDVRRFRPVEKEGTGKFVFLLVARMLWDKGVGELVEAMRTLKPRYPHIECRLLGSVDAQNPAIISREQMQDWVEEGVVNYLGVTDDVVPFMREADCVVLPSYYREGVPRSLLEAASLAKPIITTDNSGCRDVVDDGVNGYLCRPRDAAHLAEVMEQMLQLPASERTAMGRRGRQKMLDQFDEQIVIQRYLEVVAQLTTVRPARKLSSSPSP